MVGQVEHDVARITSCNDVNNKIALTINVDQDYFDGGDGWGLIGDDWVKVILSLSLSLLKLIFSGVSLGGA